MSSCFTEEVYLRRRKTWRELSLLERMFVEKAVPLSLLSGNSCPRQQAQAGNKMITAPCCAEARSRHRSNKRLNEPQSEAYT